MNLKYDNIKSILKNVLCGLLLGLSVVIPGLNAPTIMIILGIYNIIIYCFSNVFRDFKNIILYIFPIIIGVIIGLLIGIYFLKIIYINYPFYTLSFFGGMMIGSYPQLFISPNKNNKLTIRSLLLMIIGFLIPLLFIIITSNINLLKYYVINNNYNYVFYIILGIILSITQLIPGLSATVILILFDCYDYLINNFTLKNLNNYSIISIYILLIIGFVIGIIIFSKFINKVLNKNKNNFHFITNGLVLGSIIALFSSNECISLYNYWKGKELIINVILGLLLSFFGFIISFILYLNERGR